ncbi:MAG: cellulase family glycosylhydrolase [Elusimicrobiota bacterium]
MHRSTIALLALAACLGSPPARAGDAFVTVSSAGFRLEGRPYHFVGANLWYAMNLGAPGPGGDRKRLRRELDRLKALGVDNLRVVGLSEGPDGSPWRMAPAAQNDPGVLDEDLMRGLDFALVEMGKRGQKAVIVLNNFWPWSGGMAQYLAWDGRGPIPYPPPAAGGDWAVYQKFTAAFYSDPAAMAASRRAIAALVGRRNTVNGRHYADDPAIMSWELANEPRGDAQANAFNDWIDATARFVKSLDRRHLVTTGCEGDTARPVENGLDFARNHSSSAVDYATIHVWPQNWEWYDPARSTSTYPAALERARAYLRSHFDRARALGKPLVVEEFGLARDGGTYDPAARTTARDGFFSALFEEAYRSAAAGGPVAGVAFWAWAGEGRAPRPGAAWKAGDPWIGDPPHEFQGWYSVYDKDAGTAAVIARWARAFTALDHFRKSPATHSVRP